MKDNTPHYTELPIAQLEENKGQLEGIPATPPITYYKGVSKIQKITMRQPQGANQGAEWWSEPPEA